MTGSNVKFMFNFLKTAKLFFKVVAAFCTPCSVAHQHLALWPRGRQHTRLPCCSPSPRVCSNSHLMNWWWRPTISFSVVSFLPSIFPRIRIFSNESGCQSTGASASASVLPMNIQDWFPLGLTGLIPLQSKELSRVKKSSGYLERKIMSDIIFWQRCTSTFLRHAFSYIFLFA